MYVNEVTIEQDSASTPVMTDNPTTINIENIINITHDGSTPTESPHTTNRTTVPPNPSSPTPSQRSASISIASIESDALSSVIESDVDEYEDAHTGCMVKKLGRQTDDPDSNPPIPDVSPEIAVLLGQKIAQNVAFEDGPQVASLSLTNSTDVTFGHKKYHKGPVTIQQILIEKPTSNGKSNPAFEYPHAGSSTSIPATTQTKESEHDIPRHPSTSSDATKKNYRMVIIAVVVAFFVVSAIGLAAVSFISEDAPQDIVGITEMISRDEWLAQPPNVPLEDQETPVSRVILTHTMTQNCSTQAMCVFRTRFIQTFDMESKSYDDIRYNFLVGGDGNVYIGRGWDKVGAHTKGFNDGSIGIAFIGTFNRWLPPDEQLNATRWLLDHGVRLNKLDPDYKIYGARQLDLSDGPGDLLFEIIKKWPHWVPDTYDSL